MRSRAWLGAASPSLLLVLLVVLAACGRADAEKGTVILATTTSTEDSGLLDEIVPAFEEATGYSVKSVAVGSGQALELGRRGEADVLLVHSPGAEEELVASGTTGRRLRVMHNDFLVVGPPSDPAGAAGRDASDALQRIAERGAAFVSRGDDSGTHVVELDLWEQAGVDPGGDWYAETGQGMGATLQIANQQRAYTLVDRATFLSHQGEKTHAILVEGDPALRNVYHVIEMTRRAGDAVNEAGGRAFADFVVSEAGQDIIGRFGVDEFGQRLFVPDAQREAAGG